MQANHGETSLRVAAFSSGPCAGQGQSEVRLARHPCAGRASSPLPSSYLARKGSCSIASFKRACSGAPQTQQTFTIRPFLSACQRWMLEFCYSTPPKTSRGKGYYQDDRALLCSTLQDIIVHCSPNPPNPEQQNPSCLLAIAACRSRRKPTPAHITRIASHRITCADFPYLLI